MKFSSSLRSFKSVPGIFYIIILLSLTVTLLNAAKPLYIDDTCYYYMSEKLVENPLKPLDLEIFWLQWPTNLRNGAIIPPVLPYWLAGVMKIFGENPFVWKLNLFPMVLAFISSSYFLLKKFAPELKMPLLLLISFSPAFLPSWNLMLDMPSLSLIMASVALFIFAGDRQSIKIAILSGIVAALAIQIKYIAITVPCVIFLYGLLSRRFRLGLIACFSAVAVFLSIEAAIYFLEGESIFISAMTEGFTFAQWPRLKMLKALLMTAGAMCICIELIVLASTRINRFIVGLLLLQVPLCFLFIANKPIGLMVFTAWGYIVVFGLFIAFMRLLVIRNGRWDIRLWKADRQSLFLFLWLALEIAVYFVIAPFSAVRRLMGIIVVLFLIAGRAASSTSIKQTQKIMINLITVVGIIVGLGFYAIDLREAKVAQNAAFDSADWIQKQDADANIWYVGHWGFAYYADQCQMQPVIPDHSVLKTGDWLVFPDRIDKQKIELENMPITTEHVIAYDDQVKLQTMFCYYAGDVPLQHRPIPRLKLYILRVKSDFIPQTAWHPLYNNWDYNAKLLVPVDYSLPYLTKCLRSNDVRIKLKMINVLSKLGKDAAGIIPELQKCLQDENIDVRNASSHAIKAITSADTK